MGMRRVAVRVPLGALKPQFFKSFPSALTPIKFRMGGSQNKIGFGFLPADRGIEPGTAG